MGRSVLDLVGILVVIAFTLAALNAFIGGTLDPCGAVARLRAEAGREAPGSEGLGALASCQGEVLEHVYEELRRRL